MALRLGRVCRRHRLGAELDLMSVAVEADVSQSTISNFEIGSGWRRETDRIVDAYARLCGIKADQLWLAAIKEAE
jgi:hypothetical protein